MLHEFLIPLVTLACCAVGGIAGLDRLCLFHQTYQSMVSKLESERWLLDQCSDPHFFSKMHQHSDLCFQVCWFFCQALDGKCYPDLFWSQVENNARVGAFMLSLRHLTQSFLPPDALAGVSSAVSRLSWPVLGLIGVGLLVGPSWLVRSSYHGRLPRWPECADTRFKNA